MKMLPDIGQVETKYKYISSFHKPLVELNKNILTKLSSSLLGNKFLYK